MRILWLCNVPLPRVSDVMGIAASNGGGWLVGISEELLKDKTVELGVCFPHNKGIDGKVDNLSYFAYHESTDNAMTFEKIINNFKPDLIHIFGTEYKHSYDMVVAAECCGVKDRTVISIQGLVSVYARHYTQGIPKNIVKAKTLRDCIKNGGLNKGQQRFIENGKYEEAAIKSVSHVIGRTDWDYACVKRLNRDVQYHFCNETLRPEFYDKLWSIDKCERHSIFVSQCSYPIKGFHYMLEAMRDIVQIYPDAHLYTTGRDIINADSREKLKFHAYAKYLYDLIYKYNLQKSVTFLGNLNGEQMCEQYLKANVFASPSAIENSPNSVGEAMITGCPVVSSDVGGVKNMLTHEKEGFLYQSDAPYMLAYYIMKIFEDDSLATELSKNAMKHAIETHDRQKNMNDLMAIYNKILSSAVKA